jgi:expansin (peptidoglycan-binding protein)
MSEKQDAARWDHCRKHSFPVRNQTGTDDRRWIAIAYDRYVYFGATPDEAVDKAIDSNRLP